MITLGYTLLEEEEGEEVILAEAVKVVPGDARKSSGEVDPVAKVLGFSVLPR